MHINRDVFGMKKLMTVFGYQVTEAQEKACVDRMHRGDSFSSADIEDSAQVAGVPRAGGPFKSDPVRMRLADRLIQRERKAGTIKRVGNRWIPA